MRGGSQAHLLETDQGFYVVKFFNNPQGHRVLTGEFISSLLMHALGLLTPEIAVVMVPDALQNGSGICIGHSSGKKMRPAGVHFGSRYPGESGALSIYDLFPDEMLPEVVNREDFWGALVFDKWVSNADARQAMFYRARIKSPEDRAVDGSVRWIASMIDNGFAFQGREWCFRNTAIQGLYGRPNVYNGATSLKDFECWFDSLFALRLDHLQEIVSMLPPEWIAGEERELWKMLKLLMARRKEVPCMVADSLDWLKRSHAPASESRFDERSRETVAVSYSLGPKNVWQVSGDHGATGLNIHA
jgi:hypothetical protein